MHEHRDGLPAHAGRVSMHVDPAARALRYYVISPSPIRSSNGEWDANDGGGRRRSVVAAIVPWNGPAYLSMLKIAPALALVARWCSSPHPRRR